METCKTDASAIDPSGNVPASFAPRVWRILTLSDQLGRRVAVVVWLAAVVGLGLFLGWGWLVTAGMSSIVLGFLPCVAMCALGLCGGHSGKKCSDTSATKTPPETAP